MNRIRIWTSTIPLLVVVGLVPLRDLRVGDLLVLGLAESLEAYPSAVGLGEDRVFVVVADMQNRGWSYLWNAGLQGRWVQSNVNLGGIDLTSWQ